MPFLTCYDFTSAKLMRDAGVPGLLVGDSAASVILGYDSTLPVSLRFLIDITSAVRRGHPQAFLVADMPFGSYHASTEQGVGNIVRMIKRTGCDAVKLEVSAMHLPVIERAAAGGVGVIAHLGLRPQAVGILGGYRTQARTEGEQEEMVALAQRCERAGAVALLLEAVPSDAARRVVEAVSVPVIGCGAGPACHAHVVVTHDLLGLSGHRPKFVPGGGDVSPQIRGALESWVENIHSGTYPGPEHEYGVKTALSKNK